MNSLSNKREENFAGIYGLMLAMKEEVESMPTMGIDGTYLSLPTLVAGKSWGVVEFTEDTASFSGNPKRDSAGTIYKPTISLKIAKLEPDVSVFMDTYSNAGFIVAAGDRNGLSYILGTPETPARLNVKNIDGGNKIGDFNGLALELYAHSTYPLRFCAVPVIPDPLPPRKVFSSGFSFGFLRTP